MFELYIFSRRRHCSVDWNNMFEKRQIRVNFVNYYRPFQERHAISCTHVNTGIKAVRSMINCTTKIKLLTTHFYYVTACVWSRYVPILMVLLNRWLLLIIKLKLVHKYFDSENCWFYIKNVFCSVQFTSI